jgi:hypothetical protein
MAIDEIFPLRQIAPMKQSPADIIIDRFGGPEAVAGALGLNVATVYKWSYPRPRGRGGFIPSWHHAPLLKIAQKRGLRLSARDFIDQR